MAQTQTLKTYVKNINVFYNNEGVIVSADVPSRSRKNIIHYTRIILDPLDLKIIKETCSCEGYTFRKKCWHLKMLEQLISSDEEIKEKIESTREMSIFYSDHSDVANWG
jgi:hypothetical protein